MTPIEVAIILAPLAVTAILAAIIVTLFRRFERRRVNRHLHEMQEKLDAHNERMSEMLKAHRERLAGIKIGTLRAGSIEAGNIDPPRTHDGVTFCGCSKP